MGAPTVERVEVSAYRVPTDEPESDGTLQWDSTTIVVAYVQAGGERGLGYTYGDSAIAHLIESKLAGAVLGSHALHPQMAWAAMQAAIRNDGQAGIGAMAVSCLDIALWDLKARLLGLSLADLLGRFRDAAPIYGSGGFTSYSDERLREQLSGWVEEGIPRVKIKVGRDPASDPRRLAAARDAIGDGVELFADANGAYTRKEALRWAEHMAHDHGVTYLEEPVSSDDLEGLRLVRDRAPAGLAIAAGEYHWSLFDARRMLAAGAVDILQADVTRVGGVTAFLRVDALCRASSMPLSAHCAPQISAHAGCACETLVHLEYFHDHARIERMLFAGAVEPEGGALRPDPERLGHGLELDARTAERCRISDLGA